jgi:hypothetical protein
MLRRDIVRAREGERERKKKESINLKVFSY